MSTNDKRSRAYNHLEQLVESAPEAAAKALLTALYNQLSADDFIGAVENEFEWEDDENTDDEWTDGDGDGWTEADSQ